MADPTANSESLSNANPAQGTATSGTVTAATALFDVNKMAAAWQNYSAMNAVANEMFGYEFKWFRAVPQQRSKDVIFQEYTLSNVDECPLDVKAVVPQGVMPDSKYTFDLMGLEYDVPVEVQIDKRYWEGKAGYGTAPQKKDIVYFTMANKLYQVESSYLYRGFMEQETAWRINLRKYQPESSRREGDALRETIDSYTVGVEEIFGEAIDKNVKKLVDDPQFSQLNGTSEDKYKRFDTELKTVSQEINLYGTVVAQSFYDMQTPVWYDAITYAGSDAITESTDRSVMAWVCPRTVPGVHREHDVTSITANTGSTHADANYVITLKPGTSAPSDVQIDHNVDVYRPGELSFYAKIVGVEENPLRYYCVVNPFVLADMEELKTDWYSQKGYKLVAKDPISVIDGANDSGEHVFSVNVHANQYISINYGHTYSDDDAYVVRMSEKMEDGRWYGVVANVGNSWKQYNVSVWTKHETDKNAKLQNTFTETLKLVPEHITVHEYTVNRGPCYWTNLRIFDNTIELEKQANELLSCFTGDADHLVLADNGDALMRLPYVSKQR